MRVREAMLDLPFRRRMKALARSLAGQPVLCDIDEHGICRTHDEPCHTIDGKEVCQYGPDFPRLVS